MSDLEGMEEIVQDFLIESSEGLDQLDGDLVALEQDPKNREIISSIFRTVHTVKGTSGMLGFSTLESVTHVGESLMSKLRDGEISLNAEITTGLLALVDAMRSMLEIVESDGNDGGGDYSALIDTLTRLQGGDSAPAASPGADGEEPSPLGQILVDKGVVNSADLSSAAREQLDGDPRRIGEILVDKGAAQPGDIKEALQQQTTQRGPSASETSIRVHVSILDRLMNLVGELVLARNQILQNTQNDEDAAYLATCQRLNLVTTELQESVMKTRMQPIGSIWSKFPRVVRDISHQRGKRVRIEMEGKDTELDKSLVEAIKDPLMHIVRNSVDHGIETPEDRIAAGKDPEGVLTLRSYHEGGQVIIEVSDDGAGINIDRVRAKAIEKGVISVSKAETMSERELVNLVFAPGFSTAEKVTNISGRGVGMDVVKSNIERIGGTVELQSRTGEGSTLRIKIPLTLAIVPALLVGCAGCRFAIPQVSLVELLRLTGDQVENDVESIHGAPVYRLRGRLLPLVYMDKLMRLKRTEEVESGEGETGGGETEKKPAKGVNIVVLQADETQFGLVVDDVSDTQEIVVKPLGKQLSSISVFSGATIMGDGQVALILDVLGIAKQANVVSKAENHSALETGHDKEADDSGERSTLLLFRTPSDGRMAVPLIDVARLEKIDRKSAEFTGGRMVVQYRGEIMPLIEVASVLPDEHGAQSEADLEETDSMHVVVFSKGGKSAGLIVRQIMDIVDEVLEVTGSGSRAGVTGTAVIDGKVTELLDTEEVIRLGDPTFFDDIEKAEKAQPAMMIL